MALNGTSLGDTIAGIITASDASEESKAQVKALWEKIGKAVCDHIVQNLDVQVSIPSASVIISVSGGAGAPAVGVPNPSPISNTVTVS